MSGTHIIFILFLFHINRTVHHSDHQVVLIYTTKDVLDSDLFLPVGLDNLVHFVDFAVQAACGDKSRELPEEQRQRGGKENCKVCLQNV